MQEKAEPSSYKQSGVSGLEIRLRRRVGNSVKGSRDVTAMVVGLRASALGFQCFEFLGGFDSEAVQCIQPTTAVNPAIACITDMGRALLSAPHLGLARRATMSLVASPNYSLNTEYPRVQDSPE